MKKDIQLCGIGNSLVDLQYEVGFDVIETLGATLGQMLLIETGWQSKALAAIKNYKHNICSGGSAANTIIGFSQFGGKAAYMTVLGNDAYGEYYKQEFFNLGIVLRDNTTSEAPTGTCLVLITPDSERTMLTALGATALFAEEHVDEELIARSEWLYCEGYKFTQENSSKAVFKALDIAKKSNTKIALTFSDAFITWNFAAQLTEAANSADLIFCNELEARTFTKSDDANSAFRKLSKLCPNVAMTSGENGSKVLWNEQVYSIPPYPAKLKDTTGAGDMYAAGFLYGIIHSGEPIKAGHLASSAAAKVVSQLGARLKNDHKAIRDKVFSESGD